MESRFNDCPAKEWLQDNLYTHIGARMKSNVMMVGSQSIKKQITNGFKIASTPKAEIYLIENNRTRYYEMNAQYWSARTGAALNQCPENWPDRTNIIQIFTLICREAARLDKPVRFEDLSIEQTMSSMRYLIGHRLLRQSSLKSKLRKCMLVTSSLHRCDIDETLDILHKMLNEILGVKAAVWPNAKGRRHAGIHRDVGVREYAPYIEQHGRLVKNGLRFFSYWDRSSMFTCMILYV